MLKIEKLIPGGQALATDDTGKKIFLWNALPEEEVDQYQITKNKSRYAEAIATNIVKSSIHRIEPKDACYLATSPWQIMDYNYELAQKQALVVELFREHQINISSPEIITDGKDYFYRNKMEYSLYYDHSTAKISPAFHLRGTHHKIPITTSSIERPEIFTTAIKIIQDLNLAHEEARKYQSLLLRCDQIGKVSGGLFENHQPHPVFENLTDSLLGYEFSYSPNGFFQINLPVYELALRAIQPHVSTTKVLDLYSGVGTIGLSVAKDHELTLVEVDKSAYRELCKNIVNLNSHAQPILAKSESVLDYITPDTTVILDPPRAGCDTKLIDRLLEVTPPKIIYLSCNPATQARDAKALLAKYHIEEIKTFNFFPRTPHIENLIILSR
ncbi:class I SAM-dependent RNA methyltransferase [Candidatus Saccharibacteria bacterium]|nr:class I SAM-dependent RNA methyltransferase [Candidatus Saccharibacteria bacterium]